MAELAESTKELKLDLACGQTPREGYEGVDFYAPDAQHKVDLFKFPYPWNDNSVDAIHCSHFAEHLPARSVEPRDLALYPLRNDPAYEAEYKADYDKFVDKDFLFAFMDECYRILKPNCRMQIIVPAGQSVRGFQDPTHRRFFVYETFFYFVREWRTLNKLDHYQVNCNFGIANLTHTCAQEHTVRHPEWQEKAFKHYWNMMVDIHALLQKIP